MNAVSKTVRIGLGTLLTLAVAAPVVAQERLEAAAYRTEAAVAYSLLRDVGELGKTGFLVDFGKQVMTIGNMQASVVGEFAVHKFSGNFDEVYVQGAGGLRLGKMASDRVRAFGQIMVGPQYEFGSTGFVIQPGGGVSVRANGRMDTRIQVDFPVLRWEGKTYKQFRFSAGVGIAIGRQ